MNRDDILSTLRHRQADLAQMGVRHAALFGSVARGDDRPDSDVDVMIDVDSAIVRGIFAIGHIQQSLQDWIGRPVDLARRDRLHPGIATEAEHDAIDAF
jgi:predicted nucleotidyltransferase